MRKRLIKFSWVSIILIGMALSIFGINYSSAETCIVYNEKSNSIKVDCEFSNLSDLYHQINNDKVLKKENNGVWLLNSELIINKNTTFHINSTDTSWLKIVSDGKKTNGIISYGNLLLDSTKITSWNTTDNNYSQTDGQIPRAYITIGPTNSGQMNITNSEIAYLGYHKHAREGLAYIEGGDNSVVKNNNIHHMWYGFFTDRVGGVKVEGNHFHQNYKYGIDPHTASFNLIIRNNEVHDTIAGIGIICSLDCYNILIENNIVYRNKKADIMFSRNMTDSIVRNNILFDSVVGISVQDSKNNLIYNNTISNSTNGIVIYSWDKIPEDIGKGYTANKNKILNNVIINSTEGIVIKSKASGNLVQNNIVENAKNVGIKVTHSNSLSNSFIDNLIKDSKIGFEVKNNISYFSNNTIIENEINYRIKDNSQLKIENSILDLNKIQGQGNSSLITVTNSKIIPITSKEESIREIVVEEKPILIEVTSNEIRIDSLYEEPVLGSSLQIKSPMKQILLGKEANEVECKKGYVLLIKNSKNTSACVKPQTSIKLIKYDWGKIPQKQISNHCNFPPTPKVNWSGCDFTFTNLKGIIIPEANLDNADLSGATLENANLEKSFMSNMDLLTANLAFTDLSQSTMISSRMSQVNFQSANFQGADLSKSLITKANLSDAIFIDAKLESTSFKYSNLRNTDFTRADLSNANFLLADLSGANLSNANLSGANLSKANLTNVIFGNCSGHEICD